MNLKQIFSGVLCALAFACTAAQAQTTAVSTEHLMTLYAPLEAPRQIDGAPLKAKDHYFVTAPTFQAGSEVTPGSTTSNA